MPKAKSKKPLGENNCKFCKKSFASPRTLAVHLCVKKKRFADKNNAEERLAFNVYQRFFKLACHNTKPKTVLQFIDDRLYSVFVKFARHLRNLKALNPDKFVDYLILGGFEMKQWMNERVYKQYLIDFLMNENPTRSIERSILVMDEWAQKHNMELGDYFEHASTYEITDKICTGYLSPWAAYLSSKSGLFFERLTDEQVDMVSPYMNAGKWENVFRENVEDIEFLREALKSNGI